MNNQKGKFVLKFRENSLNVSYKDWQTYPGIKKKQTLYYEDAKAYVIACQDYSKSGRAECYNCDRDIKTMDTGLRQFGLDVEVMKDPTHDDLATLIKSLF